MKSALALIAITMLLCVDPALTETQAVAASARCVAGCTDWCAKNFARKNPTACSEQCQLKHCR